MKVKLSFVVVVIAFLSCSVKAMDKPEATLNLERMQAHFEFLKAGVAAIEGDDAENQASIDDFEKDFLALSPDKFRSAVKERFKAYGHSLLAEKGVTQEMLEKESENAEELVNTLSAIEESFSPVSSPIKREVQEIANSMGLTIPEVRKASTDEVAYSRGKFLVLSTELLERTPRKRKVVYRHELEHMKDGHSVQSCAQELARKKAHVVISPTTHNKIARIKEVVCDIEATKSPTSADAMMRMYAQKKEEAEGETPTDMPHLQEHHRWQLAAANRAMHNVSSARKNLSGLFDKIAEENEKKGAS